MQRGCSGICLVRFLHSLISNYQEYTLGIGHLKLITFGVLHSRVTARQPTAGAEATHGRSALNRITFRADLYIPCLLIEAAEIEVHDLGADAN